MSSMDHNWTKNKSKYLNYEGKLCSAQCVNMFLDHVYKLPWINETTFSQIAQGATMNW